MARTVRDVVFVDGVRTPYGKADPKGIYAESRADDLVINCIRELLRRNPSLPPQRVDDVAIAATTQIGDQGLTVPTLASSPPKRPRTSWACRDVCAWSRTRSPASRPRSWGSARVPATEKALAKAGMSIDDIGLFEINEAFAVRVLTFLDHFGIADDDPRVNPYGGGGELGRTVGSHDLRERGGIRLARVFPRPGARLGRHAAPGARCGRRRGLSTVGDMAGYVVALHLTVLTLASLHGDLRRCSSRPGCDHTHG